MKYIISIIGIILFCTNSFAKILDQAIVIIEDDVITQNEYQQKLKYVMNNYRINNQPIPNDLEAFRKQVLDHMINTRLQINYARRNGLEVKEWMIDNAMEDMAQKNKVTLSEYR